MIIVLYLLIGCECVPGLDTPKVIDPQNSSSVAFIHSLPDIGSLNIVTSFNIYSNLNYSNDFLLYNKLAVMDNLVLKNINGNIIYRQIIELSKDSYYTMIFFGAGNRIREIFLYDSISGYESNFALVRFVHTAVNTGAVRFSVNDSMITSIMTYGSYTEFKQLSPSKFSIKAINIVNDSLIAINDEYKFEKNRKYLVLLKGYFSGNPNRPLECRIMQYEQSVSKKQ